MSKVFNMVGGGGGKNISSIIITGPKSTDTIVCTKDGKSYTATWDSTANHWEIVGLPLGTFTVTATRGINTQRKTVLIDIAGVYEIEINFNKLWLYRDGDECEDVTGGWTLSKIDGTGSGSLTKESSRFKVTLATEYAAFLTTGNTVDLTGYSKIVVEYSFSGNSYSYLSVVTHGAYISIVNKGSVSIASPARVSISSLTNNVLYLAQISTGTAVFYISKIWLEK